MSRASVALFVLSCVLQWPGSVPAQSLDQPERAQSARFAASRQNPDGGFSAEPGGTSSLGTTTAPIRVLRYSGGSIPDVLKAIAFVRSCFDPETGGFSQVPGGVPDVGTTAGGLMALAELRSANPELVDQATAYLSEHAKSFPDRRIAVAGFEAVGRTSPVFEEWAADMLADRNEDGTWGSGASLAFDTGGTVAALLRMGVELDRRDAAIEAIRKGQNDDGGWTSDGDGSDLPASYRVMRAAYMMGEAPDLDALRDFVARCRRDDGGYAVRPDEPAPTIGATYMALILLRWADLLEGSPPVLETAGFRPLFNGRDLDGWEGDADLWSVEDGMIVGSSPGIERNEFLASRDRYSDFVFKASFRLVDGQGNSGIQFRSIQFRSERSPGHEMIGYQADIGEDYWGCLYDESRRNRVLSPASDRALEAVRESRWNQYTIRALGDQIRLFLNGESSVNYTEEDPEIARSGRFGLQIHSGPAMEVHFKNLLIQPIPQVSAASDPFEPGFHQRALRGSEPEDRYAVFVPEGYDGRQAFPVVLFLHGPGESGDDGIRPIQVGLGPAIAANPSAHPYIAVFPQARETWAADSSDASRALEILDEVLTDYQVDRSRVVLTGLSMGGMGTWSIAAAHPTRFSSLVPICGAGDPETVEAIRAIPVWSFVGDNDRPRLLDGMREMTSALIEAGAPARYTEYLGIGHNSWDRAYSEPELVEWMLQSHRIAD